MNSDERKYWLDEPNNVKKVIYALFIICVALFLADALYYKHSHFEAENFFGFYAIFGFVVCVALVLAAKWMRILFMRPEDYYDAD